MSEFRLGEGDLYVPASEIHAEVSRIAETVGTLVADHESFVYLVTMRGANIFGGDLMREEPLSSHSGLIYDTIQPFSYEDTESTGNVEFKQMPENEIEGQHLVVVEDILDTGLTACEMGKRLRAKGAASIIFTAIFDKPEKHGPQINEFYDHVVTGIPLAGSAFAIGYCLDWKNRFRQIPYATTAIDDPNKPGNKIPRITPEQVRLLEAA